MSENLLYMGSVFRARNSEAAWGFLEHMNIPDPQYLITQLYLNGAVNISGALILSDQLPFSGSFDQKDSIYEIIGRLSLASLNTLAATSVSPFSISEETYNSKPVSIQLIKFPE